MMMKSIKTLCVLLCAVYMWSCSAPKDTEQETPWLNLVDYVDPFIGTGGHGHVFIGANVPFGTVQLGPVQFSQGWDW